MQELLTTYSLRPYLTTHRFRELLLISNVITVLLYEHKDRGVGAVG